MAADAAHAGADTCATGHVLEIDKHLRGGEPDGTEVLERLVTSLDTWQGLDEMAAVETVPYCAEGQTDDRESAEQEAAEREAAGWEVAEREDAEREAAEREVGGPEAGPLQETGAAENGMFAEAVKSEYWIVGHEESPKIEEQEYWGERRSSP